MSSDVVTPTKKSPAKSMDSVEDSLAVGLDTQLDRDLKYIAKELKAAGAGLASHLAGLLRDGVLLRAYQKALDAKLPNVLGKKLPNKAKTLKNLPPSFKARLLLHFAAEAAKELRGDDDSEDCVEADLNMDVPLVEAWLELALGMSLDCPLPCKHDAPDYENPMLCVLSARHQENGNPLAATTLAALRGTTPSFFFWEKDDKPQEVKFFTGEVLRLSIPVDVLSHATDLILVDAHNHKSRIESKTYGYTQVLPIMLKLQHGKEFAFMQPPARYEKPDGCPQFRDSVPKSSKDSGRKDQADKAEKELKAAASRAPKGPRVVKKVRVPTKARTQSGH